MTRKGLKRHKPKQPRTNLHYRRMFSYGSSWVKLGSFWTTFVYINISITCWSNLVIQINFGNDKPNVLNLRNGHVEQNVHFVVLMQLSHVWVEFSSLSPFTFHSLTLSYFFSVSLSLSIYIYIYVCVCVCVVFMYYYTDKGAEKEKERKREKERWRGWVREREKRCFDILILYTCESMTPQQRTSRFRILNEATHKFLKQPNWKFDR